MTTSAKPCNPVVSNPANIPAPLASSPHWLLWSPTYNPAKEKWLKKPLSGNAWQENLQPLSRVLPHYLASVERNQPLGLGFCYSADHQFICVDIDDFSDDNISLVKDLDSFTEYSPSGQGAHIIVSVDDKKELQRIFGNGKRSKATNRDLFISIGFVTFTNNQFPDTPPSIRHFSEAALITILSKYFKQQFQESAPASTPQPDHAPQFSVSVPVMVNQVKQLLLKLPVQQLDSDIFNRLSNDEPVVLDPLCTEEAREPWLIVGQALHHTFSGSLKGYQLWKEWSEKGSKFNAQDAESTWKSFKTSTSRPITISTLVKLAQRQKPDYIHIDSKEQAIGTIQNYAAFLAFNGIVPTLNELNKQVVVRVPAVKQDHWGCQTDALSLDTISALIHSDILSTGSQFAKQALNLTQIKLYTRALAGNNPVNPIRDYFKLCGERWDKRDYLEPLMRTIITPANHANYRTSYRYFIRKWLLQVVAAACHTPDNAPRLNRVLVFQGPQNIGKTKWVAALFPHSLRRFCAADKEFKLGKFKSESTKLAMELTNTLICNINEIDRLLKSAHYSDFKAFLDQTNDQVVLPYGDAPVEMTRRTVFIGSTNEDFFLVDKTGNRRIEIISVDHMESDHDIDIDQLWGQIYSLYQQEEKWWLDERSSDQLELQAIIDRDTINSRAMAVRDESSATELDELFDASVPFSEKTWKKYTLKDIRSLLGLNFDGPRSSRLTAFKETLQIWLAQIPEAPKPSKGAGPRPRVYYWMPPLRTDSFPAEAFATTDIKTQPVVQ